MYYGTYQNARDAAWQCLLDHKIDKLHVSLKAITDHYGIRVVSNRTVCLLSEEERGRAMVVNSQWYIVVNDNEPMGARRFTIAHELGHILMKHAAKKGYSRSTHTTHKPSVESAADTFASRLLCPAIVLYALNIHTPQEIMEICDVSYACAEIRAKRMEVLYQRNRFFQSPLERQVYENFRLFIESRK